MSKSRIPLFIPWYQRRISSYYEEWCERLTEEYDCVTIKPIIITDQESFKFLEVYETYIKKSKVDEEGDTFYDYTITTSKLSPEHIYVYKHYYADGIGFKRQKALLHGRKYAYFVMADQNVEMVKMLSEGDHYDCNRGEDGVTGDFIELSIGFFEQNPHVMMICPTMRGQGSYHEEHRYNLTISADKFYVFNTAAIPPDARYDITLSRFGEDRDFYLNYGHGDNIIKDKRFVICVEQSASRSVTESDIQNIDFEPYINFIKRHKYHIYVRGMHGEVRLDTYINDSIDSPCFKQNRKIPIPQHATIVKSSHQKSDLFSVSYKEKNTFERIMVSKYELDTSDSDLDRRRAITKSSYERIKKVKLTCHLDPNISPHSGKYTRLWVETFKKYFEEIVDKYYDTDSDLD